MGEDSGVKVGGRVNFKRWGSPHGVERFEWGGGKRSRADGDWF